MRPSTSPARPVLPTLAFVCVVSAALVGASLVAGCRQEPERTESAAGADEPSAQAAEEASEPTNELAPPEGMPDIFAFEVARSEEAGTGGGAFAMEIRATARFAVERLAAELRGQGGVELTAKGKAIGYRLEKGKTHVWEVRGTVAPDAVEPAVVLQLGFLYPYRQVHLELAHSIASEPDRAGRNELVGKVRYLQQAGYNKQRMVQIVERWHP